MYMHHDRVNRYHSSFYRYASPALYFTYISELHFLLVVNHKQKSINQKWKTTTWTGDEGDTRIEKNYYYSDNTYLFCRAGMYYIRYHLPTV